MWIQGLFHPRIPQIHESRDVVDEVSSVFMVFELMAIGSEGRNACKGSGWHWTYQVVLAFNLESLPSKLVLVSTVLLSTMMVLVFKTEIERWGFLCGPKIEKSLEEAAAIHRKEEGEVVKTFEVGTIHSSANLELFNFTSALDILGPIGSPLE